METRGVYARCKESMFIRLKGRAGQRTEGQVGMGEGVCGGSCGLDTR